MRQNARRSLRFEPLEDRLTPTLGLDPSFGVQGRTFITVGPIPLYGSLQDAVVRPDGKIWALGAIGGNSVLVRFNANGELDPTFDGDGVEPILSWSNTISSFMLTKIALQADGKVVLAGSANEPPTGPALPVYPGPYSSNAPTLLAMRLNDDGTYDTSFGVGGRALIDLGTGSNSYAAANTLAVRVLADGRIALAGNEYVPLLPAAAGGARVAADTATSSLPAFIAARLTADGRLDPTLDGDGVAFLPVSPVSLLSGDSGTAAILADGRTVFTVARSTPYATPQPQTVQLFSGIYRLAADGSLDTTFNGTGYAETVVASSADPTAGYNSISPARSFVGVQPDGSILTAVSYSSSNSSTTLVRAVVTRFTADGHADTSFAANGLLDAGDLTLPGGASRSLAQFVVRSDGRFDLLVTTATSDTASVHFESALTQYTADGALDATVGPNGAFSLPQPTTLGESLLPTVLVPNGGKLLLGGTTDTSALLGSRIGFVELTDNPPAVPPTANNQNPVGRFVLQTGPRSINLDPAFGDHGSPVFLSTTLGPVGGTVSTALIDGSGKYLVLGQLSNTNVVARFNADGTLDTTFDGDGVRVLLPDGPEGDSVTNPQLALQADGKILIAGVRYVYQSNGVNEARAFVRRLNADGSDDASFGAGGLAAFDPTVPNVYETLVKVAALANGRIELVSTVNDYSSSTAALAVRVRRVNADGTLDTSYAAGGIASVALDPTKLDTFGAVVILSDGSVLVSGTRKSALADGSAVFLDLVKVSAAGATDTAFGAGGYAERQLQTTPGGPGSSNSTTVTPPLLAVQPDGSIVAGAQASLTSTTSGPSYSSATNARFQLVRFTPAGQSDPTFGDGGSLILDPTASDGTTNASVPNESYLSLVTLPGGGLSLLSTRNLFSSGGIAVDAASPPYLNRTTRTTTVLRRFTANGQADASFGLFGTFETDTSGGPSVAFTAAGQVVGRNGQVVLAGGGTAGPGLERLATNLVSLPSTRPTVYVSGTGGTVEAFQRAADGKLVSAGTVTPFPGYTGIVRVATADLNGDGFVDTIFATGSSGSKVRVVLGFDPTATPSAPAPIDGDVFESTFDGGVTVATGDVDGDGKAEIAVTPNAGGSARVIVFSLVDGRLVTRANFFGIDDPNFRGGGTAALGDLDGDGKMELIVAAGLGGGPRVAIYAGRSIFSVAAGLQPPKMVNDFFAFPGPDAERLRNGVSVTAGDINGDHLADLVFGGGPGGAPRVYGIDGKEFAAGRTVPLANFFVGNDSTSRDGVRFVLKDLDGDGRAELIANATGGVARAYQGAAIAQPNAVEPTLFDEFDSLATAAPTGVFVG